MVASNSVLVTNRAELLKRILEIVQPLLGYLDEPLDQGFRAVVLQTVSSKYHTSGLALTRDGRLWNANPYIKNPWRNAKEVSSKVIYFEPVYKLLIGILLAKAGKNPGLAEAIHERLMEIQALVREYASIGLPTEPVVSNRQSITDVSFKLGSVSFSDGSEETRLVTNFSALCPLRRFGCSGHVKLEGAVIAVDSVLGKMIMRFRPDFLSNDYYRSQNPFYCNDPDCACAFRLSSRQITEVVEEAKNFFQKRKTPSF